MDSIPDQKIRLIRRRLLSWFRENGRDFPWRQEKSPFKVLAAEMLLQRTHACQVEGVYKQVTHTYSTPEKLMNAEEDVLRKMIAPLGMISRVSTLKEAARILVEDFGGRVPGSREALKKLKGVGDYIAGVLLAQVFKRKEWFIDGNVTRVLKKSLGLKIAGYKYNDPQLKACMKSYMRTTKPRVAAMAILDFGATVCIPAHPKCGDCPLRRLCGSSQ
jgi:A/G-specific adenine glycosylase